LPRWVHKTYFLTLIAKGHQERVSNPIVSTGVRVPKKKVIARSEKVLEAVAILKSIDFTSLETAAQRCIQLEERIRILEQSRERRMRILREIEDYEGNDFEEVKKIASHSRGFY
jgi:hypothetical protein